MTNFKQKNELIGQANSFLEVLEQISQIAPLSKPVLIIGERGTGKELIAARLHYLSTRWEQIYLTLNCAALNENLLETELFGYDSGAFTGATKRHEGRFERADNGTLFLDEIANTSRLVQEKLLRVVEYGEFERVGGSRTIKTNARLIAATNEDLPSLADAGEFRADLLDRLAFDVITLPPLRERREDILRLAEYFAVNMARELKFELFNGFSEKVKRALLNHNWPGNIRELKNVVERSVYRNNNPHIPVHELIIDPFESPYRPSTRIKRPIQIKTEENTVNKSIDDDLKINNIDNSDVKQNILLRSGNFSTENIQFPVSLKELSHGYEVDLITSALASCQFNQKKTAQALKLTYHQLRGYLKKYNLLDNPHDDAEH